MIYLYIISIFIITMSCDCDIVNNNYSICIYINDWRYKLVLDEVQYYHSGLESLGLRHSSEYRVFTHPRLACPCIRDISVQSFSP